MFRQLAAFVAVLCVACVGHLAVGQTLPADAGLPAAVKIQKDIAYAKPEGAAAPLQLDLYLPPPEAPKTAGGKFPVLLRLAPHREVPARPAAELLNKGYALLYAAYLPDDAAHDLVFNHFPADLFAAKAAVRWIRGNAGEQHFDGDRIGVWAAGHGATLAALLAMTADQKDLAGNLGDYPNESNAVRTLCLFSGTTDWRNAELYGDETVNLPGSPAYQLFGGNPKDFPDATRQASAITYIRPNSPPVLMVTLASDSNRAMHLIFAETLHRAGVPSALYEEPPGAGAGLGGRAVDEARLDRTILEFFADTLAGKTAPAALSIEEQITQLTNNGLYKQARRMIEEQVEIAAPADRQAWLKKIRDVTEKQQAPALKELVAAINDYKSHRAASSAIENGGARKSKIENHSPPLTWTSREVLTDPEHIGEYHIVSAPTNLEYDARANALRQVEILNNLILQKDFPAAQQQVAAMRTTGDSRQTDAAMTGEFLARYAELRAHPDQSWPPGVKPVAYALASGQDLYGFWFTMRAGGVAQRFRFIPPGNFAMGSPKSEWARLPDEPLLEPTEIKEGFWLADAPVTQETWEGVMGKDENRAASKDPKAPATNLSYAHAINFLEKLNVDARLPTAAQWEYACRAGSADMYPVTGRLSDSSWFWDEAKAPPGSSPEIRILSELETDRTPIARSVHPVRQKLPNRWGIYDMQGNVWEWCAGTSPEKPREYHLAKGGSWISIPQSCRAARTAWFPIEEQAWNLGLRILIPAQANP